jgi:putative SOS response-associated peptidase YedK
MCGRYNLHQTELLKNRFKAVNQISISPDYNRSPGTINPVIISKLRENWILGFEWGIPKQNQLIVNKRIESINQDLGLYKRCLVPINGYYEWKSYTTGKIPFYIFPKNENLISLAGIYYKDSESDVSRYLILTKPSNQKVEIIHSRMPIIIPQNNENQWLNKNDNMDLNFYDIELEIIPVSKKVNNPQNSDASCIKKSDEYQTFFN